MLGWDKVIVNLALLVPALPSVTCTFDTDSRGSATAGAPGVNWKFLMSVRTLSPPVAPVNPTYAQVPPITSGTSTCQLVMNGAVAALPMSSSDIDNTLATGS